MQQVLLYTLTECMPVLPWAGAAYAFVLIIIGVTRIKEVEYYFYRKKTLSSATIKNAEVNNTTNS